MRTNRSVHRFNTTVVAALLAALSVVAPVHAHDVIPEHEKEAAQRLKADGPTETVGVDAVTPLGSVPLAGELPGADGKVLRAREFMLAPGATIAVHEHQQRPGLAYILEGELVEHRNDQQGPIVRGVGAVAFERSGVVHYWKNESGRPARALVVDIVDAER
jgi:quercetin dioxygenase-like cupin family protein